MRRGNVMMQRQKGKAVKAKERYNYPSFALLLQLRFFRTFAPYCTWRSLILKNNFFIYKNGVYKIEKIFWEDILNKSQSNLFVH